MVMSIKKIIPVQAVYYIITGLWPLININSFMGITGPKIDLWLVKMVGLLAAVIGFALLFSFRGRFVSVEARILGIGSALSFIYIDTYYVFKEVIAKVYLVDACLQLIFVLIWIILIAKDRLS